jgi:hypothetical protein
MIVDYFSWLRAVVILSIPTEQASDLGIGVTFLYNPRHGTPRSPPIPAPWRGFFWPLRSLEPTPLSMFFDIRGKRIEEIARLYAARGRVPRDGARGIAKSSGTA